MFTYIFRLHKLDTVIELAVSFTAKNDASVNASFEIITEEIKDRPGGDANDVPTEKFSEIIQRAVADII